MSKYQIGEVCTVKVKEVKPYAAFITFDDGTLGMLHISEISDKFINDIERYVSPGDTIAVKLIETDPKNGFARVSYKKVPSELKYSDHTNVRKALDKDEEAFKTLKEKIPEWIKEALDK